MIARRLLLVAALFALAPAPSHAATGLLKSQRSSGASKVCLYEVLGSPYTVNVDATQICPLTIEVPSPAPSQGQMGIFMREQSSGLDKVCYYAVLGTTKTLTVSSVSLCPRTHQFE